MKPAHKYALYVGGVAVATAAIIILFNWRKKIVRIAKGYSDIVEIGANAGFTDKEFEKMMREVGWRDGEAWCMYLAKGIYIEAFPKYADEIKRILNGSTQASFANAKNNPDIFEVITDGVAEVGDIVIWQSTTNAANGHAGIVVKKTGTYTGKTVEGNTSLEGAREGQGSEIHDRKLKVGDVMGTLKVKGFIRMKR